MAAWKYVVIVAVGSFSSAAYAQDDFPMMDWGPTIQTEAMNSAIDEAAREGAGSGSVKRRAAPARPIGNALSQSLARQTRGATTPATTARIAATYTPSTTVRQKLAGIMGDAAAKNGAATGQEMRQMVLSGKALTEYQRAVPTLGLRPNDAIDGYAFYMLAQWTVANDHRADITRAQAAGVRRQAANAYATVADQISSDALRQEFAEMLIIQGMILAGVHEAAVRAGDDAATAKYAALARQGGQKIFTIDPVQIELTDAGFRQKR